MTEYKAKIINGVFTICPVITNTLNKDGGNDIMVKMPNISKINAYKAEILNKMVRGERVDIEVVNG